MCPEPVEFQRSHVLQAVPGIAERVEGGRSHSLSNEARRSVPFNRSGRHGPARTPSPSSSCVRPQHRSILTARAFSSKTPKSSRSVSTLVRVDRDNAHDAQLEPLHCASSPLPNVDTHRIKRRMQDAADQAPVRHGQLFAQVGFGIGELAKETDMRTYVGATW